MLLRRATSPLFSSVQAPKWRLQSCSGSRARSSCAVHSANESTQEITTLTQPVTYTHEVKKSKFVVTAWPVDNGRAAIRLITEHSDSSASHNCFAYKCGQEYRTSDDGEPGGTAGRPILSAIDGEGLQDVAVLVTRHFGGIKLGAGGLVRAYGGAARETLRAAPKAKFKPRSQLEMTITYEDVGSIYALISKFDCERLQEDYVEGGALISLKVALDADACQSFVSAVSDCTSGKVVPAPVTTD